MACPNSTASHSFLPLLNIQTRPAPIVAWRHVVRRQAVHQCSAAAQTPISYGVPNPVSSFHSYQFHPSGRTDLHYALVSLLNLIHKGVSMFTFMCNPNRFIPNRPSTLPYSKLVLNFGTAKYSITPKHINHKTTCTLVQITSET